MANINIAVVNHSSVVADADVAKAVKALQKQVTHDFAPAWGIAAHLRFAENKKEESQEWLLTILDNSDQAGALGYHDMTQTGMPLGKVFAKTDLQFGENWTVTTSHELLEMLADPMINLTVFDENGNGTSGRLYAYEVCDACEADQFGYAIDGVQVSDFVYPAWFESFRGQGSAQFDKREQITKPFQLLAGGYIGIYDVLSGHGWTQLTAEAVNYRARPPVGSRRERRNIPISKRLKSTR